MRSSRAAALALTLTTAAAALSVPGCGGGESERRPDPHAVSLTRAQVEAFEAAAREAVALRAEIASLEARLKDVEMLTGIAPFVTPRLQAPPQGTRVSLREGTLLPNAQSRGKKENLAKHLEAFDGYVVAFWATWCKPCIADEELALLHQLQTALRRQNVELVSVPIDDLAKVRSHEKAPHWLYPLWHRLDGHLEWLPRDFVERVGLSLPLFLVVAPGGEVRWFRNQKLDPDVVRDIVGATANICRARRGG